MPLRWASCLFRPSGAATSSLEVNPAACPVELQEQLVTRGTSCLRPRGSQILYERFDDAGQGAFTPPVLIYLKRMHLSSGLEVCVKRTLITHFIGRAAREARLQVQLQHPHLLPALASVRGRHHYYLVLPAAEGDLWAEVESKRQRGSGYSEEELRDVARQMLLGLEHLHASHLAHRDIKPANLLRMSDGRVVVADFGCADGCTAGFVAAGTTQFQPPECRRGSGSQLAVLPKGYDQRTQDMWSVGATLGTLWFARMPEVTRGGGVTAATAAGGNKSGSAGLAGAPNCSPTSAASLTPAGSRCGEGALQLASASATGPTTSSCAADDEDTAAAAPAPLSPSPSGSSTAAATGPAEPPPPLSAFLAAAGFASCGSTVGACGEPMSLELLDLLASLLRLRPSERATASQALQHAWLTSSSASSSTAASGLSAARQAARSDQTAGAGSPDVRPASSRQAEDLAPAALSHSPTPTPPRRQLEARSARSAGAMQPLASSASSPLKRLRTAEDRFLHFFSHQQLLLHRTSPGELRPGEGQREVPVGQLQPPHPQQQQLRQELPRPRNLGIGQYRQSTSALEHVIGGYGAEKRCPRQQARDALRQSHDGEITLHFSQPGSSSAKQAVAENRVVQSPVMDSQEDQQQLRHLEQQLQQHLWLSPTSLPQQQQKHGVKMTLRVFVGAGAEPANSS